METDAGIMIAVWRRAGRDISPYASLLHIYCINADQCALEYPLQLRHLMDVKASAEDYRTFCQDFEKREGSVIFLFWRLAGSVLALAGRRISAREQCPYTTCPYAPPDIRDSYSLPIG